MISALCLGDFWFIKLLLEAVLSTGADGLLRRNNLFLNSTPVDLVDRSESLERVDFAEETDLAEEGLRLLSHLISVSPS